MIQTEVYDRAHLARIRAAVVALADRAVGVGFMPVDEVLERVEAAARIGPLVSELGRQLANAARVEREQAREFIADSERFREKVERSGQAALGASAAAQFAGQITSAAERAKARTAIVNRRPPSKTAREAFWRLLVDTWIAAGGQGGNGKELRRFLLLCAEGVIPPSEVNDEICTKFLQRAPKVRLHAERVDGQLVIVTPNFEADDY
jgi:hypothetical protein